MPLDSQINSLENKILVTDSIYFWVTNKKSAEKKNKILFFGNDLKGLEGSGIDKEEYIKAANLCLDFLRKNFRDFFLYYKSHPADLEEKKTLNLEGFKILGSEDTSEIFLWKNFASVHSVFSINSWSSPSAKMMGLNAYLFLPLFRKAFGEVVYREMEDYLKCVPESVFINNLNVPPPPNTVNIQEDLELKNEIKNILDNHPGKIWFAASDVLYVLSFISLSLLIKSLDPNREVGLIAIRHHRWEILKPSDLVPFFNQRIDLPRNFYSSRPNRFFSSLATAFKVKKLSLAEDDLLMVAPEVDFTEDCLISYSKCKKIGVIMYRDYFMNYDERHIRFNSGYKFSFTFSSWFYNKIVEPAMGLQKRIFKFYHTKKEGFFLLRYQKPLEEIFDRVIILKVP